MKDMFQDLMDRLTLKNKNNTINKDYMFYLKLYGNDKIKDYNFEDIDDGDVFYAKDVDGKYIKDDEGNTLFEAVGTYKTDICGNYIDCKPLGLVENHYV